MSSEYSVLSTIIILLALFLYFSWFISSVRFNTQKLKERNLNEKFKEKSFLKSFIDPDLSSKCISFFLIMLSLFLIYKFVFL